MSPKNSLIISFLYFRYTLLQSPAHFGLPGPPTGSRQIEETYYTYFITYLLTYLLTLWCRALLDKLTVFSARQEIPHILWKPKIHYRSHKCTPPVPILSEETYGTRVYIVIRKCSSCTYKTQQRTNTNGKALVRPRRIKINRHVFSIYTQNCNKM